MAVHTPRQGIVGCLKIELPVNIFNDAEQALVEEWDVSALNQPGFAFSEFLHKLGKPVTDLAHAFGRKKNKPE